MPRLTQGVPKYCLHRQSKQAIVTIYGRDQLLGPHGTKASKVEYDRLIGEWLAVGRSQSFGAPRGDYTIVELAVDNLRQTSDQTSGPSRQSQDWGEGQTESGQLNAGDSLERRFRIWAVAGETSAVAWKE